MKIAIIMPDGLSILLFCKGIIKVLQENIKDLEIYAISDDGIYKDDIRALKVKSIKLEMYRYANPWKDFKYLCKLYQIIRREQFDVIINFSTKPNIYGSFAGKVAGVKKIISHVVGMGSAFMAPVDLKGKFVKIIFKKLYFLACRFNDKVWFTNNSDYNFFLSEGFISKEKAILTKNYLNINEYSLDSVKSEDIVALKKKLNINVADKVVVMVARMIWPKGIKEFAESAELLKIKYPQIKFILIAPLENDSPDSVPESYIREKEKTSNMKWLGFQDDVKSFYAISDIAVLPTYYREGGYPRALTEPMAMGKPIIAANSEHCRGTVEEGKNGYLVPVKDSKALANAIEKLIKDDRRREEFGVYSRKKAIMEFDENVIIKSVIKQIFN